MKRGQLDAVIAGLLFMAGMRRSEVSALRWADLAPAAADDGVLVTVRRGKTNPEGEARDVRFVKGDVAVALGPRARRGEPGARGPRGAALAADGGSAVPGVGAGVEARVTAHSARVGLAAELTRRGAVDDRRDAGRELEDLSNGGGGHFWL